MKNTEKIRLSEWFFRLFTAGGWTRGSYSPRALGQALVWVGLAGLFTTVVHRAESYSQVVEKQALSVFFRLTRAGECPKLSGSSLKEQALRSLHSEKAAPVEMIRHRAGAVFRGRFRRPQDTPGQPGNGQRERIPLAPLRNWRGLRPAPCRLRTVAKAYFTRCAGGVRAPPRCERANVETSRRRPQGRPRNRGESSDGTKAWFRSLFCRTR